MTWKIVGVIGYWMAIAFICWAVEPRRRKRVSWRMIAAKARQIQDDRHRRNEPLYNGKLPELMFPHYQIDPSTGETVQVTDERGKVIRVLPKTGYAMPRPKSMVRLDALIAQERKFLKTVELKPKKKRRK